MSVRYDGTKISDRSAAENTVEVGPKPSFYWLLRREFARNTTRKLKIYNLKAYRSAFQRYQIYRDWTVLR